MNCTEFQLRIQDALDRGLPLDDSQFSQHAAYCRRCRRQLESHRALSEAIAAWKQSTVSHDVDLTEVLATDTTLTARVWQFPSRASSQYRKRVAAPRAQALQGACGGRNSRVPQTVGRAGYPAGTRRTLAAVLLATAALSMFILFDSGTRTTPHSTTTAEVKPASSTIRKLSDSALTKPAVGDFVRQVRTAYLALAEETAGAARDVCLLMPTTKPVGFPPALDDLQSELAGSWINKWPTDWFSLDGRVWDKLQLLWESRVSEAETKT